MPTLVRRLGLWSSIGIVIGITIGGGIFRTPAGIADARARSHLDARRLDHRRSGRACAARWRLPSWRRRCPRPAGCTSICARAGAGRYAFLYGWAQLVLIRAAALGGISSVFGEYCLRVFGIDPAAHGDWADYLAAGAIAFAAIVNIVGVQLGALFTGLSTVTKFGALALLVAGVVRAGRRDGGRVVEPGLERRAGRCRPVRARADLGALGLRRLRRPVVRQRRGQGSAAQPAARHHLRHAGDHRHLRFREHRLSLREPDRRGEDVAADCRRHDVDDLRAGRRGVHLGRRHDLDLRLVDGQYAGLAAHLLRDGRRPPLLPADRGRASEVQDAIRRDSPRLRVWASRW